MTKRQLIRRIINEEIVGRFQPSPYENASDLERRAELVLKDFFTLTSRGIERYVQGRAQKYQLDTAAEKSVIIALYSLFTEQTLRAALVKMHNELANYQAQGRPRRQRRSGGGASATW